MLARLRRPPPASRAAATALAVLGRLAAPGEQRRPVRLERGQRHELRVVLARRARPVVSGRNDDRRLEALARVDGQHPDAVALRLEVALDLRLVRLDLGEKAGQRRRLAALVGEREREELVDRVGGVVAEPRDQRLAAAVLAEQAGVEGVGAEPCGARAPLGDPARGGLRLGFVRGGERARRATRSGRPRARRARRRRGRSAAT